jgi:ArsR family transcriptional regulator, arsenate/arsenite/antimonite-responsive transcriptional repressor
VLLMRIPSPAISTYIDVMEKYGLYIDARQYIGHTLFMPLAELLPVIDVTACCAPLTQEAIDQDSAEDLARSLKALADPARLRLVSMVAAHEDAEACVCDLTEPLGLSQPTVSHHLKVLVDAGMLTRSKRGTWAYYRLVPGALDSIARLLITV